jgi:hypothetical protein
MQLGINVAGCLAVRDTGLGKKGDTKTNKVLMVEQGERVLFVAVSWMCEMKASFLWVSLSMLVASGMVTNIFVVASIMFLSRHSICT